MNLGEMTNLLRLQLVSVGVTPPINDLMVHYLNEGYTKLVNGMDGVADEEELIVPADATEVESPAYVLKLKSAKLSDETTLGIINLSDETSDQAVTASTVKTLTVGAKKGYWKVGEAPVVDTTIIISIDRLPREALKSSADIPSDVSTHWHQSIIEYAKAQVFSLSEKHLPLVAGAEAKFDAAITKSRKEKVREKSKPVRSVVYGGL